MGNLADSRRQFLRSSTAVAGGIGVAALTALNSNQAMAAGDPIPIGGGVPLTGWAAADGIEFKRGLELAVEEINAAGGILGTPVTAVFEDTKEQGADNIIPAMQRLIDRHKVHAIINGYNTGAICAEYDSIGESGVIYIHNNTDISHHAKIKSNPKKYAGIFMMDPAEYWYGEGLIAFVSNLKASGQWKPKNNKIAIVTSSQNYSMVIAQAIKDKAPKYDWNVNMFETVVTPISEWGPTLAKLRKDPPAVIAVTHWVPQDLAQFMIQFVRQPIDSLVYMQYGPALAAFREIGKAAVNGVLYSTVVGCLQDEMGKAFSSRYKAKFGKGSSPEVGAQSYQGAMFYAIAAAMAGGSGGPGNNVQNAKVADRIRSLIYRGPLGTTRFTADQAAVSYPTATNDPSLGMPHQFLQHQDFTKDPALIAPQPYVTRAFAMPPWIKSA